MYLGLRCINTNFRFAHTAHCKTLWLLLLKSRFAVLGFDFCCTWFEVAMTGFFGFVFKGERNVSYFFFIFAAYPWTRKCVFFSILIDWLRKSRVRNWNDNFLIGKKIVQKTQITTTSLSNFPVIPSKALHLCSFYMIGRISAHAMNIFHHKNFNFGWLYLADFLHCEHQQRFPSFLIWTFVLPK